jgi:sugar lactone lactonase YvrE
MLADVALAFDAQLGESPLWDSSTETLVFVDISGASIVRWNPASDLLSVAPLSERPGAIGLRRAGGLVLSVESGFWLVDAEAAEPVEFAAVAADRVGMRMNDGKCDPAGRFWSGTMADDEALGAGSVYRLDADGRVTQHIQAVTIPNGIDWSVDARTMYFIDSATRRVDAFDFDVDEGRLANRRVAFAVDGGIPDGLSIDAEGSLWVALWGAGEVRCYTPSGRVLDRIRCPTPNVTSLTFGGTDLRDVYVTSAREGLEQGRLETDPHAGAVFGARSRVPGRPSHRFRG